MAEEKSDGDGEMDSDEEGEENVLLSTITLFSLKETPSSKDMEAHDGPVDDEVP